MELNYYYNKVLLQMSIAFATHPDFLTGQLAKLAIFTNSYDFNEITLQNWAGNLRVSRNGALTI